MNEQLDLFDVSKVDFGPQARRTDARTSHARSAKVNSFSRGQAARILKALADDGPANKNELARRTGLTDVEVARLGAPLARAYRVTLGPDERDGCQIWRLALPVKSGESK